MVQFDITRYKDLATQMAQEGIVLLKNRQVLPFAQGTKVSIFGRSQLNYYKSGTGSGGMVNTAYVVGIVQGLEDSGAVQLNRALQARYQAWGAEHPFDKGLGWAQEPWSQEEMPLSEEVVAEAAAISDAALILIGRTAGEDKDNQLAPGSMQLTPEEENMLRLVCRHFAKAVVVLNTGNILDMAQIEAAAPAAILYAWHGGQEGGRGVADILTGKASPSGKLTDTIPVDFEKRPTAPNFGDRQKNIYAEDIYVGYRYYETFAREQVRYPFGFGLSYTSFAIETQMAEQAQTLQFTATVKNTGNCAGKETVQIYAEAPQGALGKPARVLCAFQKTKLLQPGEAQTLTLTVSKSKLASFDDSGVTGHPYCYVLEAGEYHFYAGTNVRDADKIGSFTLEKTVVMEQLKQALAPVTPFKRLCHRGYEAAPLRAYALQERVEAQRPEEISCTGDQGWKLADVHSGRIDMRSFVSQIPAEELCILVRGEGMCSPKVTPGTAAAFGGITPELQRYGIPAGCCADGPSGIRMDCGTLAFSIPSGQCIGSAFNPELTEELFAILAMELQKNQIDVLLGPGMNLHRDPLNGRNFEYLSEDPYLTGELVKAQLRGLHRYGVDGAIKHLTCNNQEAGRRTMDVVVSERALRELYLKPFEMAVKEADAQCVMSSYNAVNGLWTASSYDLLTTILRDEWGFTGMVMTDWHAVGNEEGQKPSMSQVAPMIRSQNDLYMVVVDAVANSGNDNLAQALADGRLRYSELCRSAGNICRFLMRMPTFRRSQGEDCGIVFPQEEQSLEHFQLEKLYLGQGGHIGLDDYSTEQGKQYLFQVFVNLRGHYKLHMELCADTPSDLAQLPMTLTKNSDAPQMISLMGYERQWKEYTVDLGVAIAESFYLKVTYGQSGLKLRNCWLEKV